MLSTFDGQFPIHIISSIDQQLPVLATFTPALKAEHSLEYSIPAHPHTGSYIAMQYCCSAVGVQVVPAEQDVVQGMEVVTTAAVVGLLVGGRLLVRRLRASPAVAVAGAADTFSTAAVVINVSASAIFMMLL